MAGLMDYVDAMLNAPALQPENVVDNRATVAPPQQDFTPNAIRRFDNMANEQGLIDVSPFFLPGPKGYGAYANMYRGAEREVPNLSRFDFERMAIPTEDAVQRGLISQDTAWDLGSSRAWQKQLERQWDNHPIWKYRDTLESIIKNPMTKPTVSQATSIVPRLLIGDDDG
jgi:hypothetical protein